MTTDNPKPSDEAPAGRSLAASALLGNGAKFKIIITLDAELVTDTNGASKDQICDLILADDAYGLKSIVVGKTNPDSEDDHDTEIIWNSTTVEVSYDPELCDAGGKAMTTQAAKRRAVGEIEWVIDKLKTHALMTADSPVTVATLRLLPSSEQCTQLAGRLGAALVELGHERDERVPRSQQRVGRRAGKKRQAKCKPTGRVYRTVDDLVAAECSPEVQAEYARLRSEDEGTPTD